MHPVFFDPDQRRWRRVKLITASMVSLLSLILAALISSVVTPSSLPRLAQGPAALTQQVRHAVKPEPTPTAIPVPSNIRIPTAIQLSASQRYLLHKVTYTQKIINQHYHSRNLNLRLSALQQQLSRLSLTNTPIPTSPTTNIYTSPTLTPAAPVIPTAPNQGELIGFFVNWDDNSFTSLKQNITNIDKLIPEWLHLADSHGTITPDDPAKQQQVVAYIRQNRPNLPLMPLINNYDSKTQSWPGDVVGKMLSDPTARSSLTQSLLAFVESNHFAGISIDFENVPSQNQGDLVTFMSELYGRFHPLGLEVSLAVPVDNQGYDYRSLSRSSDYLILMAYDEHWNGSQPGPIASQAWFANAIAQRFAEVDPSKCVVAIGAYGYDWATGSRQATDVSFGQAISIAQKYNAQIVIDPVSLNPTLNYTDDQRVPHQVWFLDAISAFNQIAETHRYPVRGIALWRLGSEDPSSWQVFTHRVNLDGNAANMLSKIQYVGGFAYAGNGEISKVSSSPTDGKRGITYNANTGLISGEQFLAYPSSYVITQWGASDKTKIALTFDDGPDPRWTPQILGILKQYNVPATFFIIGSNGVAHPDLLQQIYAQGHEIGIHTFTHPDISTISAQQLQIELNATERLLESVLGHGSILFRPPYGEDVQPNTLDQIKPLLFSGQLGYYTIGMQIDPVDYLSPGLKRIVQRVVDQASSNAGNIVLLHDSGGDRSQTIAALPLIIQELRARGYQLVTLSNLMGLTRDQVMPPVPPRDQNQASINSLGFQTTSTLVGLISTFFIIGIALGLLRFIFISSLAVVQKIQARTAIYPEDDHPSVSILVPTYNESRVIEKTIYGILNSTYEGVEIIVVDDGSSDNTYEQVLEEFNNLPRVKVYKKQHAGKAQALNFAIERSHSEIVIIMDADTLIMPEAVGKLVRHFADPQVAGVAGNAKVGNRINLMTVWQALEYIVSQNLDRRAFSILNCITVVPGAIGAWRRELISKFGGFTSDTLAEDTDLTLRFLRLGYRIDYEEDAIALTEAPDTVSGFLKQRFRWAFGTLQAARKNIDTLFRSKYRTLGLLALPNILIFQIFFPFISPLMDVVAIMSLIGVWLQKIQHPIDPTPNNFNLIILFYLLFLSLDFVTAFFAVALEKKEDWRLIIWLFPQRFFYRQLMYYTAVKTVVTAVQGRSVGWNKVERKATVNFAQ